MKKTLLAVATIVLIALASSCKNEMFLAKKLEKLPTNVITPADLRKNYNIETTAVEKLYPSGLESFGDTIPQAYLDEWTRFIMDMGKALKDVELSDDAFKPIEAIISSMTPAERANPALLNGSRKNRIAKGSGTTIVEVNRFLKQFEQTSKMMKKMQQMQGLRRR